MYDEESGFYYLRSRYYDPYIGRFINADNIEFLGYEGDSLSYNLFLYCGNNPVMGYDFNGNSDFWRTVKAVGLEFVKAGVVVAGIAASVALVVGAGAATYFSGGTAAVAVPAIMTVAATLVEASLAVAAVGVGVAAAGAVGENIEYSKSSPKGKSFRGGTKIQRDRWYGYNERPFQKWFEREGKKYYNDGMDIDSKEIADAMYEIWKELGCPFPK